MSSTRFCESPCLSRSRLVGSPSASLLSNSPGRSEEGSVPLFAKSADLRARLKMRRAPTLDGCKSPFGDDLHLPSIAVSRKAHSAHIAEKSDNDEWARRVAPRTPEGGSSTRRSLNNSYSMPTIQEDRTPLRKRPVNLENLDSALLSGLSSEVDKQEGLRWPPAGRPRSRPGSSRYQRLDKHVLESYKGLRPTTPSTAASSRGSRSRPSTTSDSTWTASAFFTSDGFTPSQTSAGTPDSQEFGPAPITDWRQGEEIGRGTYGMVYKAQDTNTGNVFVVKAAKIMDDGDKKFADKLQKELEICQDLKHRHIVSCLGSENVDSTLYIFLEYVPGGSLRQMVNSFGALEPPLLQKAMRGVLKGLNYLHNHNPPVVHRDLKGANVLVDLNFCVKLADFGCSKRDLHTQSFSTVGSIHWVAPEVLMEGTSGRKADIWSVGCVALELATAADPWGRNAFDNFVQAAYIITKSERTPPIPETLPADARDLISQCVQRDPNARPWANELLNHDFLASPTRGSSRQASRVSQRPPPM